MRIAIVGYGKMGGMIHRMIRERTDWEIAAIIDPFSSAEDITSHVLDKAALEGADAAIDFSSPESAVDNIMLYASMGLPAVIGTTGWYTNAGPVRAAVEKSGAAIIYSGNFSLGVSLFLSLVEKAGQLINGIDSYDAAISEVHHRQKADSPSGTALMAAERILATVSRKKGLQIGNPDGRIDPGKLAVSSMRVGSVPGIHTLTIDGAADMITITHTARSREGFAEGAIKAAAWICRQKAGLYTMDDFISDLIGGR